MQINEWELLVVCHHPSKSFDHKHCDSGNMFLICHVASSLSKFFGGSFSQLVTTLPCLVAIGQVHVET